MIRCSILLVLSLQLVIATEDAYIIGSRSHTSCPSMTKPCLTLSEYAHRIPVDHISHNTTLEFLPGQHDLDTDITVFNVTSFTMLGSTSQGEPLTTINCIGPAAISFIECQEVRLQAVEFVHCGTSDQPTLSISSTQYFEMTNCSLIDSRSAGILARRSALALYNISVHNSTNTGLIVMNGIANFMGTIRFSKNGNPALSKMNSICLADNQLKCAGGFAAFNSSSHFLGITVFEQNAAKLGGAIFATRYTTVVFQGYQVFEDNQGYIGGGVYALNSDLKFLKSPLSLRMASFNQSLTGSYRTIFRGNTASSTGGGMFIHNSSLSFSGTTLFTRNVAERIGGGLGALTSSLDFHGAMTLQNNTATTGGGIALATSDLICDGTAVLQNNTAELGGGIDAFSGTSISFSGIALFVANTAKWGGGMNIKNSDVKSNGTMTLDSNRAESLGGGINAYNDSSISLNGYSNFMNNNAIVGAGFSVQHSDVACNDIMLFSDNKAVYLGGGVNAYIGSFVTFSGDVVLEGNSAFRGGGMNMEGSEITFHGSVLLDSNKAEYAGGGLYAYLGSSISLNGHATFKVNSAQYGGGIYVETSKFSCSGTTFLDSNRAEENGAGISAYHQSILVFNCSTVFKNNSAARGGGMHMVTSNLTCNGMVIFDSNRAKYLGGGVSTYFNSFTSFNDGVVYKSNRAILGGGMSIHSSTVTCTETTLFDSNRAVKGGGGFDAYFGSYLRLSGKVDFQNNTAEQGGAVNTGSSNVVCSGNLTLEDNKAGQVGGGICAYLGSSISFSSNTILRRNSGAQGGGIHVENSNLRNWGYILLDSNKAENSGGGISCNSSSLVFTGNVAFINNSAEQGGGMSAINTVVVCDGTIHVDSNRAEQVGGGILAFLNSSVSLTGSTLIRNNRALHGGGMNVQTSDVACTGNMVIDSNRAERLGGGIAFIDGSMTFNGSAVFTNNSASLGGGIDMQRGSSTDGIDTHSGSYVGFYGRVVLKDNSALQGGAMNVGNSILTCGGNVSFVNNRAENVGGGVSVYKNSIIAFTYMTDFTDNSALQGGGIYVQYSNLICNGAVHFNSNRAKHFGGAISANLNSSVSFSGSAILNSNIAVIGGGIDIEDSNMTCTGTIFLNNNTAGHQGGGIACTDSIISFNQDTVLKGNTALQGGGMNIKSSSLTCNGGIVIERNRAEDFGGGINAHDGSSITLNVNTVFRENWADLGGGMNMQYSDLTCDGTAVFDNNRAESLGGGIFISKNSSLWFHASVNFVANSAFEGGGMDILQNSIVSLSGNTTFINNTGEELGGGFRVSDSFIMISGSATFLANSAFVGGGMDVVRSNLDCSETCTINFTGNTATVGGGIRVYDGNITFNCSIVFDGNTAEVIGGGIFIVSSVDSSYPHCGSAVENTHARSTCYATELNGRMTNTYQTFRQSVKFINNKALIGGGIGSFSGNLFFLDKVSITNNSAVLSGSNAVGLGGGVFSHSGFMSFLNETTFTLNTAFDGGGLYASRTMVTIGGSLSVKHNYVFASGGGFHFESGSECWVTETSSLLLSHNYAGQFGGAVYVRDDPFFYCIRIQRILRTPEYRAHCLFQPTVWPTTARIYIARNYAEQAGSALYGGITDECKIVTLTSKTYDDTINTDIIEWMFNNISLQTGLDPSLISSDPTSVCLCISNEPHCYIDELSFIVFPGGTLHISVVATGQRNGTVPSVVSATFVDSGIVANSNQDAQLSNKMCTTLHYRLSPKLGHDTTRNYSMSLRSESPCHSYGKALRVRIGFLPCPSGFGLSQTPYTSCICNRRIHQYTNTCDIDTQTILRHGQYWIGWDTTSNGAILHPHCPFDYCKSENTSFPMNDTDRQCQHNRAGLLCGGCKEGFSIGFGSSRCLKCSSNSFLALILVFIVAGVVLVVFLLVCNLTVAMGTINGLIFYANIVAAKQAIYFPKHMSEAAFLRVFIAWINLDLGIETCFFDGMDTYSRTWIQFLFPLYIWTLVGIVIVMCHYFSWATRMFGRNPVAVLATLFLLSYTKLLQTIIVAMSFTYLDYPGDPRVPVWVYDGNVGYLKGQHIALFVAALLVLTFLFLPYTLVILFGQWIEAKSQHRLFSWITDYRVKPFLDAYHGPLINTYRYWPGLLLASRALLLMIFAFNALGNPNIDFLAVTILVLGLISLLTYTGRVYSSVHLHLLELSFLANSLLLATAHGMMAPVLTEGSQLALTYTSVAIAFATFIGMLAYHTVIQVRDSRTWRNFITKLQVLRSRRYQTAVELSNRRQERAVTNPQASPTVGTTSVDLRELVLETDYVDATH